MTVCVDSSLALKWVLPEDGRLEALALLGSWQEAGEEMIAPSHFFVEVASVLRQRTARRSRDAVDLEDAREGLAMLLNLGVVVHSLRYLHQRALDLAVELSQSTTYDTHYLALAVKERCEFWTADEALHRATRGRFPWVRGLGEMPKVLEP